nr:leucine-rich repeat protein kinase family protein [Tanacetum cinerariifolium]
LFFKRAVDNLRITITLGFRTLLVNNTLVLAINSLYAALGYPPLPGWLVAGGDPCAEGWQGVLCVNSNITGIILNGANLGGELGENLGTFASIIQIDLGNNHIGGPIPSNLPITIKILNLNNNHLTGVIPDSFQQLTPLTTMDLSANNLSGTLPPSMARLSSMTTLHLQDNHLTGDVGNNLFSGPIPPRLMTIPNFRSAGNPFNTTIIPSPPLSSPPPSSIGALPPDIGTKNKDMLAGSSTKSEKIEMVSKKSKNKEDHVIDMTKFFSIASLQEYTDSFSQENLVGSGMLATVYRAELPNGKQLAIKKLDDATSQKWDDERFIELVSNVSKLRNENIVALEGYCLEHGQRLFVYEYCENGTLHEALHLNDEMHEKLSWNSRVHVALQIAKALEYLHEVCQPPVVHHNLKSTNILFDNELNARVSDCGLASLLPSSNIIQLQSSGYGAPELESGSYTYQSDVYSFGVIMLELITGRKAFDSSKPRGKQYLVRWAISRLHDIEELSGMVDPSIRAAISSKALSRFADIISLCVQPEPEFRPPMSEIVQSLLHMILRNL